jgi:DNA-binding MurR/RpiR family transcriptional regulator
VLVEARIAEAEPRLSPAERRVAAVLVDDPRAVAFGTVRDVAAVANTGPSTVVRLAAKVGFDGFSGLRDAVRVELSAALAPASDRIREPAARHVLHRAAEAGVETVRSTLGGVDHASFAEAVRLLARARRGVTVVSGDASAGVAELFAVHLAMLRPGVERVDGSPVRVATRLALVDRGDVVVAVDVRRYDRWLLDVPPAARARGAAVVVVTDGPLSPLARHADVAFSVAAAGVGPFDSHLGVLALLEALLGGIAGALRTSATARLDRIEASWHAVGALHDS